MSIRNIKYFIAIYFRITIVIKETALFVIELLQFC